MPLRTVRHIQSPNPLPLCAAFSDGSLEAPEGSAGLIGWLVLSSDGVGTEIIALAGRDGTEGTIMVMGLLIMLDDAGTICVDVVGNGGVKVSVRASFNDSFKDWNEIREL